MLLQWALTPSPNSGMRWNRKTLCKEPSRLTDNPAVPMILVVEAEDEHSALILRSFEDAPEEYRLKIVGTIHAAKMIMEQISPSLVVTDYQLPDGDGSELVLLAAGSWPVIMMT